MKKKTELIFNVSIIICYILALVFLGTSVLGKFEKSVYLVIALGLTLVGNILNLIKNIMKNKIMINKK